MLVLSRKLGETIVIDDRIQITVTDIRPNGVRLGIEAPRDVHVLRQELAEDTPSPRHEKPRAKVYRILIVEDDQVDRSMIRRCLPASEDRQFTFYESAFGHAGLDYCREEKPDCVILDFRLPDIDGLEFLEELKRAQLVGIPVIVVTGQSGDEIGPQVLRRGAQGFFAKRDISSENLWRAIMQAVHVPSPN